MTDYICIGGILTKGITEIVGESATGKTQLCLQLCITVQMPLEQGGLDGGMWVRSGRSTCCVSILRERCTNPYPSLYLGALIYLKVVISHSVKNGGFHLASLTKCTLVVKLPTRICQDPSPNRHYYKISLLCL